MDLSPRTSIFGRHEFIVRRLHSLVGLVPIGSYFFIHLATNGSILDGGATFQARVDQIHSVGPTTLFFLEWMFIFLPILFHGLVGMAIVAHGKRNLANYSYLGNFRYTLQRWTGVIAMVFILYHVFHMHGWFRFEWWATYVAGPLGGARFDAHHAAVTAAAAVQSSVWVSAIYLFGVLCCIYHLANGIWTAGIVWGVWTTPNAQGWANWPCALVGIAFTVMGVGAWVGMMNEKVPPGAIQPGVSHHQSVEVGPRHAEPGADAKVKAAH